jgi:hypothetical protein
MSRKLLSIGHLSATMVCRPLDTEKIAPANALNCFSAKQAIDVRIHLHESSILEEQIGLAKNKVGKSGVFLAFKKEAFSHRVSPYKSPQFHQQITTRKHTIFQNPLQKRP